VDVPRENVGIRIGYSYKGPGYFVIGPPGGLQQGPLGRPEKSFLDPAAAHNITTSQLLNNEVGIIPSDLLCHCPSNTFPPVVRPRRTMFIIVDKKLRAPCGARLIAFILLYGSNSVNTQNGIMSQNGIIAKPC
jgi:hypothetical protein